jgi:hypothetical protein
MAVGRQFLLQSFTGAVAIHHSVQCTTWWEPWVGYLLPLSFLPFALAFTRGRGTLKSSQLRLHAHQHIHLGLPLTLGHATWFQLANQVSLHQKMNFQETINKHMAKVHFMGAEMMINHVRQSSYSGLENLRNVTHSCVFTSCHMRQDNICKSYHMRQAEICVSCHMRQHEICVSHVRQDEICIPCYMTQDEICISCHMGQWWDMHITLHDTGWYAYHARWDNDKICTSCYKRQDEICISCHMRQWDTHIMLHETGWD